MPMTELLRRAVARASRLPPDEQNAFAAFVLAELEGPAIWEAVFGRDDDDDGDGGVDPDGPSWPRDGPGQARRL